MDRKALIRQYKDTPRIAGVYRVINTVSGQTLVGVSVDVRSRLNRHRAQLRLGEHPIAGLQAAWDADGPDAFVLEVLDTLAPSDDPEYEPAQDLQTLEEMWLEKLALTADSMY